MILKYTLQYTLRAIVVALTLVLMPNLVVAQTPTTTSASSQQGGYVGFTAGVTRANIDFSGVTGSSFDDAGAGVSVYAGAMLNERVGIELFYATLGSYDLNVTTSTGRFDYKVDVAGYGIAARFLSPPSPTGLQAFTRLGVDLGEPSASCRREGGCEGSRVTFDGGAPILFGIGAGLPLGNGQFTFGVDVYGSGAGMLYLGGHFSLAPPNQP